MLIAVSVIGFILFQLSLVESTQIETYQKLKESISTVTIENSAGIKEIAATAEEQLNYAEKMMEHMNQLQVSEAFKR